MTGTEQGRLLKPRLCSIEWCHFHWPWS